MSILYINSKTSFRAMKCLADCTLFAHPCLRTMELVRIRQLALGEKFIAVKLFLFQLEFGTCIKLLLSKLYVTMYNFS